VLLSDDISEKSCLQFPSKRFKFWKTEGKNGGGRWRKYEVPVAVRESGPLAWTEETFFFSDQVLTVNQTCSRKRGAFDSAKNLKRQRRKRQSVTAKREKSQTPKFV